MATYTIDKIDYSNNTYVLQDSGALQLTGGQVTGPVTFGDSISIDDATVGSLVVNGSASFTNGLTTTNVNGGKPIYFVKGTQTAATATWTGNIDVSALYDGLTILYYLPYAGISSTNVTLNLTLSNGTTTGDINCYVTSTTRLTTHYGAGSTIMLTYWSAGSISVAGTATTDDRWTGADYWNSNTIGEYGGCCTAGTNGMARYSLIARTAPATWESLVTTSSTGTSKAKTSNSFLIDSPILYQSAGTYTNGQNATNSGCWTTATGVDSRYSFNVSKTWSAEGHSLYLVGTISNGKFTLKDTTWWADSLPNSADGYYYWYVGQMSSAYQFNLYPVHPIYYYDGGIKVYQNASHVNGHTVGIDVPSGAIFTDKKLEVALVNSSTTYYPIVGTGTTAATRQYDTNGFAYSGDYGSAIGVSRITLGNSTAAPNSRNAYGTIRLYNLDSHYTDISVPEQTSESNVVVLPSSGGTLALTSDIPSSTATPTASTISKFDSSAKMNSTDMTTGSGGEVEAFVNSLNVTGGVDDDNGEWHSVNNYLKYSKRYGSVYIQGASSGNVTLTAAQWNNIGTLPAGYRPTAEIIFTAFDRDHKQPLWCSVTTAGVVRLYCDTGQTCNYWLYGGSFPVADS